MVCLLGCCLVKQTEETRGKKLQAPCWGESSPSKPRGCSGRSPHARPPHAARSPPHGASTQHNLPLKREGFKTWPHRSRAGWCRQRKTRRCKGTSPYQEAPRLSGEPRRTPEKER